MTLLGGAVYSEGLSRRVGISVATTYLQVRVAEVNGFPRIVPLLLIVAAVDVAPVQVARPLPSMLVLVISDVDQSPTLSAISGQFPLTEDCNENCAWFPGGARL